MENINNNDDYKLSFFKPTTRKALRNRNMIVWLVIIWATAVFGFQILLRIIEKPVPEPTYNEFITVWDNVKSENARLDELDIFANSVLQVLGRVYIRPHYQTALSNAFTWSLFQIAENNSEKLYKKVLNFEGDAQKVINEERIDFRSPSYIKKKTDLENIIADILEMDEKDARRIAAPFSLRTDMIEVYTEENKILTNEAMEKYLIHNRSVLTDVKFLGFPFHYFYTAVFLLVLFIALCWIYCFITDRREVKEKTS